MKILYIHQYFHTPQEPGGTRSYWISQKLIEEGHDVYMLTANTHLEKPVEQKEIERIHVIYLKCFESKKNIFCRFRSYVDFMLKSTLYALKLDCIDLVIATSTPLTIGFPALLLKKIPYIFEVRDLWPEVPIQMGAIKKSALIKLSRWFERTIYKNATYIVALSPGMYEGVIAQNTSSQKVFMIPNMSKITEFFPREKNFDLEKKLNLNPDSFKIIHFGAINIANGIQTIIESAKLIKDMHDIEFIFIGKGIIEDSLIRQCIDNNLSNVKFLGNYSMDLTSEIVNICDISIVSFLDIPILYTNSPNKLFDSLSAGKPIIVNSAGWTKGLVEENQCGYYVNPNKPEEFVKKIFYLKKHPEVVKKMGENSRILAEKQYDKSILCQKFYNVVKLITEKMENLSIK
jgi:glycosyltransferase involved in cell wall biosynthesis